MPVYLLHNIGYAHFVKIELHLFAVLCIHMSAYDQSPEVKFAPLKAVFHD
jgi:hypothetical protein